MLKSKVSANSKFESKKPKEIKLAQGETETNVALLFKTVDALNGSVAGLQNLITQINHASALLKSTKLAYEENLIGGTILSLLDQLVDRIPGNDLGFRVLVVRELLQILSQKKVPAFSYKNFVESLKVEINRKPLPAELSVKLNPKTSLKKLKILYVMGMFPSTKHGGGQRAFEILTELSARHQIDLCSTYNETTDEQNLEFLAHRLNKIYLSQNHLTAHGIEGWLARNKRSKNYYDVIQFEYNHVISLIGPLKYFGKKTIFTYVESVSLHHRSWIVDNIASAAAPTISWRVHGLFEAAAAELQAAREADASIALTSNDADFIKGLSGKMPVVLPFGLSKTLYTHLDSSFKKYKKTKKRFSVGFIGYFDHPPNLEAIEWYLEKVHVGVRRQVKNYSLVLVGGGANVSRLREMCKPFPEITVTGYLDDFAPTLSQCNICIAPIVSGAGMRGKIHQYAALGSAFVSTPLGVEGASYIHDKSAMICASPVDFIKAMALLLNDKKKRTSVSEEARLVLKREYHGPHIMAKLEQIYCS